MLNKNLCKKCIYKWNIGQEVHFIWDNEDEENWIKGFVNCPFMIDSSIYLKITGIPPDNCPFTLEHLLSFN